MSDIPHVPQAWRVTRDFAKGVHDVIWLLLFAFNSRIHVHAFNPVSDMLHVPDAFNLRRDFASMLHDIMIVLFITFNSSMHTCACKLVMVHVPIAVNFRRDLVAGLIIIFGLCDMFSSST